MSPNAPAISTGTSSGSSDSSGTHLVVRFVGLLSSIHLTILTPGAISSNVTAVNNAGQCVQKRVTPDGEHDITILLE